MSHRATPARRCAAVVGSTALLLLLVSCSGTGSPPTARTALVTRGDVTAGVVANGAFAAVTTENLGFPVGGKLTSVKVKVGEHVEVGDLLATLDSRPAKLALQQAEASLAAQQAGLDRLTSATTVAGAESTVEQARNVVSATKDQVAATGDADREAIDRAKTQLSTDRDAKDQAEDAVDQLEASCRAASGTSAAASSSSSALIQQALQQLQSGDSDAAAEATKTLQQLNSRLGAATSAGDAAACTQVLTARSAVTAAKQKVVADQTAVVAAQQKKKVDAASGQLAVQNAEQAVVAAQNGLNSSTADRPHGIEQQQALVDAAQAAVETAEKAVDDTRLVAPSNGTVTAINGSKGEYVAASTGTTAQAPGSRAAIPGSSSPAGAAGATGTGRPGGAQFLVLSDVHKMRLVLPFEQSDAAQIKPGMKVTVLADALPGTELAGSVLSVAPSSTVTSGAISYLVTVGLDETTSRIKDGQTARGTVITVRRANVLTVPNAAVHQQGGATAVVLQNDDGSQQTVPFEAGAIGNDRTEVISGLIEGQRVVLPDGAS